MLKHLEDISIFEEESEYPSIRNLQRFQKWAEKWHREEQEQMEWITSGNPKASRVHANIKTHKRNWPYRYIISCNGTPIENLTKWVELQLKPLSTIHKAYILFMLGGVSLLCQNGF